MAVFLNKCARMSLSPNKTFPAAGMLELEGIKLDFEKKKNTFSQADYHLRMKTRRGRPR